MATENKDAVAAEEATTEQDAQPREYLEYMGEEPYGTAFLSSHTIPKGDPFWKRYGVKPTKDVVWERDPLGPGHGHAGNRMLLAVEDIAPELVPVLEKLPNVKRVSLDD
jgi:hypothetical protein